MKLQLGAFDQPAAGWINTDITPHILIARIPGLPLLLYRLGIISAQRYEKHRRGIFRSVSWLNVRKRFPYKDETFKFVFASHMLEHLYVEDAVFCVREVYRVLTKRGVFRIAVPDLDKIVNDYDPKNPDVFLDSMFESRQKDDKNRHHWHYNELSLTRLLGRVGFREVQRTRFREGHCADLRIIDNRPESLFVEAVK